MVEASLRLSPAVEGFSGAEYPHAKTSWSLHRLAEFNRQQIIGFSTGLFKFLLLMLKGLNLRGEIYGIP